ncbi:MAG: hypothetical protein GTO55_11370 [Armatimonadetes bacterium]|nr:hypothetical protein [Armatimonadota bacterium]NIM24816.1 hypothetical protein [Armatimonadota bacterium]NIM68707.1 hypothetical protein [Armatimonadota bacterium]NIM77002.1 hypothetical protein [Armatimonadota bacterium]NIN06907.1 hypothetical protein [Armatimonadota bacterium]
MWSWIKYLYVALRLATLWENLTKVNAKDPATTPESYAPAAAVLLSEPGVKRWLERLNPENQAKFTESLPLFIWGLDNMVE